MSHRHCRSGVTESDTAISNLVPYRLRLTIGEATTLTAAPNAIGPNDNWPLGVGASKPEAVDDPPGAHDSDTTYIEREDSGARQDFAIVPFDLPPGVVITRLTVYHVVRRVGGGAFSIRASIRINNTPYDGTGATVTETYTLRSENWDTNPASGVAWTPDDIRGVSAFPLEHIGIRATGMSVGDTARCTQVYAELTITADRDCHIVGLRLDRSIDAPARFTCQIRHTGAAPALGAEIALADDGFERRIFRGRIMKRQAQLHDHLPLIWSLDAIDDTWLMNKHAAVFESFDNIAASVAVKRLLDTYTDPAADFRLGTVDASLGTVTLDLTGTRVSDGLKAIADAVNGYLCLSPDRYVSIGTTCPESANALTLTDGDSVQQVVYSQELPQVRNRILASGRGSHTTALVPAGSTTIPVEEISGYRVGSVSSPQICAVGLKVDYTGTDANAGPGSLTGCTGITRDIPQGTAIDYVAQADDTAAQTAMATTLGGSLSGVITGIASQTALTGSQSLTADADSLVKADAIAARDLAILASPFDFLTYETRALHHHPVKTVTITLTSPITVSATLRIQRITSTVRTDLSARTAEATGDGSDLELTHTIELRPIIRRRVQDFLRPR